MTHVISLVAVDAMLRQFAADRGLPDPDTPAGAAAVLTQLHRESLGVAMATTYEPVRISATPAPGALRYPIPNVLPKQPNVTS